MSILKQMEETKLTPEEIQELISVLSTVLPKIESRVVQNETTNKLTKNLNSRMAEAGGAGLMSVPQADESTLAKGLRLLKSSKSKLEHFVARIGEING
jgi:hypothetical protein